jgi:hypothetical protein
MLELLREIRDLLKNPPIVWSPGTDGNTPNVPSSFPTTSPASTNYGPYGPPPGSTGA